MLFRRIAATIWAAMLLIVLAACSGLPQPHPGLISGGNGSAAVAAPAAAPTADNGNMSEADALADELNCTGEQTVMIGEEVNSTIYGIVANTDNISGNFADGPVVQLVLMRNPNVNPDNLRVGQVIYGVPTHCGEDG